MKPPMIVIAFAASALFAPSIVAQTEPAKPPAVKKANELRKSGKGAPAPIKGSFPGPDKSGELKLDPRASAKR